MTRFRSRRALNAGRSSALGRMSDDQMAIELGDALDCFSNFTHLNHVSGLSGGVRILKPNSTSDVTSLVDGQSDRWHSPF